MSKWQWLWVSRRAFDLVVEELQRVQSERDSYRDRGDRIYDETILRFGYEPATPRVRQEMKAEAAEQAEAFALDDPFSGQLDEEIEAVADEVVAAMNKHPQPSN